ESIELLDLQPERIASPGCAPDVSAEAIERASAELFAHQTLTHATGGAHAAQRSRQADRPSRAATHRHAARLRVLIEPCELRAGAQGRTRRHPVARDDLGAYVARDRYRPSSGHPPVELLPQGRLRRLHRGASKRKCRARSQARPRASAVMLEFNVAYNWLRVSIGIRAWFRKRCFWVT